MTELNQQGLETDKSAAFSPEERTVKAPKKKPFLTVRQLTTVGLLGGLTALLGLTGYGFIHLVYMKATILHIPTIIGAILEGPKVGMLIGLIFGCFSLWQNIVAPSLMSIVFLNPLVSVLPGVLIGLIAYLLVTAIPAKRSISVAITTFLTTVAHTVMVLGMTYILYAKEFAEMRHIPVENVLDIIIGICIFNGGPEAIAAAVIITPIVMMVSKARKMM